MPQIDIDSMIDWVAFYSERLPIRPKPAGEHKMNSCCPFHHEKNPSFWFNTQNGMWKCEAGCGSGNATTFLARIENIENAEAWAKLCALAGVDTHQQDITPCAKLPMTIEAYAAAKHLPLAFLTQLHIETRRDEYGLEYVAIPYYDSDGTCCATKRRYNPQNKQRFGWDKGGKPILYGVWQDIFKKSKTVVLVEGESDAQTLWWHGISALGVPGASNFQSDWTFRYIGERTVYIHVEPDKGGETFRKKTLNKLYDGGFKGNAYTFGCSVIDGCKDPSDMFVRLGDGFRERFEELLRGATKVDLAAECLRISPAVETKPLEKKLKKLVTYKASDLYDMRLEPPPIIVRGMIPSGLTVLAGAPKRGKSWLALELGICVARGDDFLGMKTTQGDVLYMDLESSQYRVKNRLQKLVPGRPPDALQISHEAERLDGDLLAQLEGWCADVAHPVLIIIDTLGRVKGGSKRGENAYEADTRIFGQLQKFAQNRKLAVVCVHHLRKSKDSDDWYERISGSNGLTGVADAVLSLGGKRGEEDSTLSISSRDFDDAELILAFNEGVWTLRSANSEEYKREQDYRNSKVVQGVLRLAEEHGYWEGTPRQLLDELTMNGLLDMEYAINSTRMSMELQPFQRMLCERDQVLLNWKRTGKKGRVYTIRKVSQEGF